MAYINPAAPALPFTQAQIAAGPVVVAPAPKMLCSVLVTTATTAAQPITFFDNTAAQGAVGTVIAVIPGGTAAGTNFPQLNVPTVNGILIQQNAALAAGAITVVVG